MVHTGYAHDITVHIGYAHDISVSTHVIKANNCIGVSSFSEMFPLSQVRRLELGIALKPSM